jgi:3-oxoacyl-[acyl-carrier protein] reductase
MKLNEMKIIVTGAASGLGKCFATQLANAGAHVMACDVDEEGLDALAEEVEGDLWTQVCDVSSEESVVNLVETTADALGGLNGLVNNAGIFRDALLISRDRDSGDVTTMTLKQWQAVIDVDLTGPFLCTREVAAHMVRTQTTPGVIVNISSVSRHGNRGQTNYSAAKAGLVADTKLWAEELSRYGIRVGAVAPGFVQTPILDAMRPEMLQKLLKAVPLGRAGKPEEIWAAVKFIIECDYFTGRCLDVDGGITI